MNRARPSAVLAAILAVASPAIAADAKSPADELARILMPSRTWEEGMQGLAKNVRARMEMHPGSNLQYPADFQQKIRSELETALPYESLVLIHAKELGASYTEPELKELLAFYRSPVGQKSLAVMPLLAEKVAGETQQRIESKMPQIMERLGKSAQAPTAPGAGHGQPAGGAKPAAPVGKPNAAATR